MTHLCVSETGLVVLRDTGQTLHPMSIEGKLYGWLGPVHMHHEYAYGLENFESVCCTRTYNQGIGPMLSETRSNPDQGLGIVGLALELYVDRIRASARSVVIGAPARCSLHVDLFAHACLSCHPAKLALLSSRASFLLQGPCTGLVSVYNALAAPYWGVLQSPVANTQIWRP